MDYLALIKKFHLEEEVETFVKKRIKEIARETHSFSFEGHRTFCGDNTPHVPHVRNHYQTVRYGQLETYCLGKEGEIDGKELVIVVEACNPGCAEYPSSARGYWLIREEKEA